MNYRLSLQLNYFFNKLLTKLEQIQSNQYDH